MAEQFANVLRTNSIANDGISAVDAVGNAIFVAGTHWVRTSFSSGKALLTCTATGAQVVLHGTSTQLRAGYAPDGGVTDWNGAPSAAIWSGLRNISGANTGNLLGGSGAIVIAEYEDAICILPAGSARWVYGVMAGRILTPNDESDRALGLGVDAIFCGIVGSGISDGNWLSGSYATTRNQAASLVRVGNVFLPAFAHGNRFVPPSGALDRAGTVERMVPYTVHQKLSTGLIGPSLGATKYIRQWRALVSHETRLFSGTPGSAQAWIGFSTSNTGVPDQNQFLLWSKTETTV